MDLSKFIIALFFLQSCGEVDGMYLSSPDQENFSHFMESSGIQDLLPDARTVGVDDELLPFVSEFEGYHGAIIHDLPVNFSDTGSATGMCRINYDGRREVRINKQLWDQHPDQRDWRTVVIFHELGHCVLSRGHRKALREFSSGNIKVSYPASIMYPSTRYLPFSSNRTYYLEELFH